MPDAETIRRVRQSLEALRAAGIEWVPRSATPPVVAAGFQPAEPSRQVENLPPQIQPRQVENLPPHRDEAPPMSELFGDNAGPSVTPDQRRMELGTLAEVVSKCMRCSELCSTRTQTVFGVGPLDPLICFIGEAPGADEDKQGEPFVGAAGQLLNKIITACGFQRQEVYICNTIKCRPPGNRNPKPEEAANCREYLDKQLEVVRPKYMVALGGIAATNLLNTTASVGQLRRKFHDYKGIPMIVTYHPAYLLPHRSPDKKKDVWEDMKILLRKMGRPIPGE